MNVLAIGAHFDDVEIGCGGSLVKHVQAGDKVIVQIITHSKYDNHDGKLMREKETARKEGEDAAAIIGATKLICNMFETKNVRFTGKLVEVINSVIDEENIDMIYTHWDFDVHQDHQAIGKATLAAGRRTPRIVMYRSNLYMNSQHFLANFFVDISETIDTKMKAIMAHKTEVAKFGQGWLDFWKNEAHNNGQRIGVTCAESFQMIKYVI